MKALEFVVENAPDAMLADGFDECIIGITHDGKVVYDMNEMIKTLMYEHDMSMSEAWEYLHHNTFCAYVGELTPVYMWPILKGDAP